MAKIPYFTTNKQLPSNSYPKKLSNKILCGHGVTRCVAFNRDGNYCMTGGSDNRIILWNPINGTNLKTYCGHAGEVTEVVSTVDNAHIASGSDDKMVMLWDVTTGVSINRWRRHLGRVNTIALNDESNVVLSGGIDKHVYVWDRRSKSINPIQSLNEARDSVISVDSHKWFILTASLDETLRVYDLRKGQLSEDFIGKLPTSVKLATDCHLILVNCSDNILRLFDYENGGLLQKFTGHKNDDYRIGCCFIKGNSHVVSGSVGNSIHVWNLLNAQCEKKLEVPLIKSSSRVSTNVVHSIAGHPMKSDVLLAAAGDHIFLYTDDE